MTEAVLDPGFGTIASGIQAVPIGEISLGQEVDLAQGAVFEVDWTAVPGATAAVVDSASISVTPVERESSLGARTPTLVSGRYELSFPFGTRLRRLRLNGLASGETSITETGDLVGLRLVVLAPDGPGGQLLPRFAIPRIPAKAFAAPRLDGASFASGVLSLPDVTLGRVGIALVRDDTENPAAFVSEPIELDDVEAVAVTVPVDLAIDGPDGKPVWQHAGELLTDDGTQTVDLRVALEAALKVKVGQRQSPKVTVKLRGAKGTVRVRGPVVRGALLRAFPGVMRAEVRGEPEPLPLTGLRLADEAPSRATAGLKLTYRGLRVLPDLAAPLSSSRPLAGVVVGREPVLRTLPAGAVEGRSLGAVGIIGRAPEACELSVWPVDAARAASLAPAAAEQAALSPPGVATLEPSPHAGVVWVEMPERQLGEGVALAVRANSGRFFWAEEAGLLFRAAVRDPDPGGRPLLLGTAPILSVHDGEKATEVPTASLPPGAFAGSAPLLSSELFLTVDLEDLTLRYER